MLGCVHTSFCHPFADMSRNYGHFSTHHFVAQLKLAGMSCTGFCPHLVSPPSWQICRILEYGLTSLCLPVGSNVVHEQMPTSHSADHLAAMSHTGICPHLVLPLCRNLRKCRVNTGIRPQLVFPLVSITEICPHLGLPPSLADNYVRIDLGS